MSKAESDILITQPLSISILTLLGCLITFAIFAFLFFGEYTQKQHVLGVLVPDKGLIKVYAPQPGTVAELHVREGESVEQGQLLYVLTSDRISAVRERADVEIQRHLATQGKSLEQERLRQKRIIDETALVTRQAVDSLQNEMRSLEQSEQLLDEQIAIAAASLVRYEEVAAKGAFAKNQLEEKRMDLLNRRSQRAAMRREHAALKQKIAIAKQESTTAVLRGENELAGIERSRENIQKNLLEGEPERAIRITAPAAGTVTGIAVKPGQWSAGTTPLLRLLPAGARLEAELYAPSNAVSFIRTGSEVLLRYRSFPYQKFGQHRGRVSYVSRAAVAAGADSALPGAMPAGAPVYRVTVTLPQQFILAYGKREPLQADMELEADMLLDTRRLYEWIVEPLFSITGKI